MLRFAFIGGTKRGYKLIQVLIQKKLFPVFGIILKEDEHETEKYFQFISQLLIGNKIPNSTKRKLLEDDYEKIRSSNLDFIIVYGWRSLIDTSVNKFLKNGLILAHQSLLPKYRGFAPLQWAMINGERETGVTLFKMSEDSVDSGKILYQERIPIGFEDYAIDVDNKLTDCAINLFLKVFEDNDLNKITLYDQNESEATYTCKRTPQDGRINWNKSSVEIYNLIKALAYPFTGAFCFFRETCYHIRKAFIGENNSRNFSGRIQGRVYKINPDGIEVLCREGTICITEWEDKSGNIVTCPSLIVKSLSATLY